jgi:hypothetical protein
MGSRKLSDLVSRANLLLWIAAAWITLASLNSSFRGFLVYLQPPSPHVPNLILASTELVCLLLGGWLFFTVFLRPKARSIIPSKEVWQNNAETLKMMTECMFVSLWRIIVLEAGLRIDAQGSQAYLSTQVFGISAVIAVGWTLLRLSRWRRTKLTERQKAEEIPDLSIQAEALGKTRQNLTEEEQQELKQLMYETETTKQATIQTLARVIMESLVFALIIEIIQEVFQRF